MQYLALWGQLLVLLFSINELIFGLIIFFSKNLNLIISLLGMFKPYHGKSFDPRESKII